jgi:hypothetical protein
MRQIIWVLFDDGKIGFETLSVRQIMCASDLIEVRQRKAVIDDCKLVDASPEAQLQALAKVRADSQGMHELVKYCFTWRGAYDIIEMSNPEKVEEAIERLSPTEISKLALRLINHEIDDSGKLNSRSQGSVSG